VIVPVPAVLSEQTYRVPEASIACAVTERPIRAEYVGAARHGEPPDAASQAIYPLPEIVAEIVEASSRSALDVFLMETKIFAAALADIVLVAETAAAFVVVVGAVTPLAIKAVEYELL
jgi:hypothetical protein